MVYLMKLLTYISLFISLSLNAQNMVIDCVYTLETEQFKSVSDTLKGYNGLIMMQSKSGFKLKYVEGDVKFVHGLLARETVEESIKPYLAIVDCSGKIVVSSRIDLVVSSKHCLKKIEVINDN